MNVSTRVKTDEPYETLADSHTLKALPQGLDAPPAGLEAFRGGLTKIGSGDAIGLDAPRMWAGVPLTTVGKPSAPAAAAA